MRQKTVKNQIEGLPVFIHFAIGQHHRMHGLVAFGKRFLQALRVERRNRGVADDQHRAGFGQFGKRAFRR